MTSSSRVGASRYLCACTGEFICSHACTHTQDATPHLKSDVRQKAEVLGVLPEVVHESAVVHVVGKMLRNGEVAETHHFLWSVDGHGFVNTRHFLWWIFLQEKTPQCNKLHNYKVIKHFKWRQVFLKSGTLLFIYCQTFTDVFSQKSFFPRERITSNQPQIPWLLNQNNGCQKREYCFSNGKSKWFLIPVKIPLSMKVKYNLRPTKLGDW